MIVKKIIYTLTFLLYVTVTSNAQNSLSKSDDLDRISLASYIPEQVESLKPAVYSNLQNKLNQIVTKYGMGGASNNERFIISGNIVVLSKEITSTSPVMHAYVLEVTLYIGDGIDGKLFSSIPITLKGVGETEIKAYNSALKNLKTDDEKYADFIAQGKKRIIEYYNSNCDFIIKEASTLAGTRNFDEALSKLVSVPTVVKSCYDKAMDKSVEIYKLKLDFECAQSMAKAKAAWSTLNYEEAASHLSSIPEDSKCATEANMLAAKILERARDIDKREWNFKLKQQQDQVDIQKAQIRAARDVGVAYGKNQPRTVTYNLRGWYRYY